MDRWIDTSRIYGFLYARTHVHPRLGALCQPEAGAIGGTLHDPSNYQVGVGAESSRAGSSRAGSSRGGGGVFDLERARSPARCPPCESSVSTHTHAQ